MFIKNSPKLSLFWLKPPQKHLVTSVNKRVDTESKQGFKVTGLYIIQIKEVLQSMPLFNLFSPNLVNFTSESESGERRDVYKGTSKSTMVSTRYHSFNFQLELSWIINKGEKYFLNWKQIPPLNFALSFFNLKCNWTELEKKKSCYTTVFLLINARKDDQSWSFGGKYSFFFKSCFMLELFPILMETCMKKENVLKLQFR